MGKEVMVGTNHQIAHSSYCPYLWKNLRSAIPVSQDMKDSKIMKSMLKNTRIKRKYLTNIMSHNLMRLKTTAETMEIKTTQTMEITMVVMEMKMRTMELTMVAMEETMATMVPIMEEMETMVTMVLTTGRTEITMVTMKPTTERMETTATMALIMEETMELITGKTETITMVETMAAILIMKTTKTKPKMATVLKILVT